MSKTEEFDFLGHSCTVILPDMGAKGKPYVWRMEFLYAFNQADMALLNMGYGVVYCSFCDEYGSKRSVELFKQFHDMLTREYGFSQKAALFGFSRGGLYAVNYALSYPGDCACLYLDAPVLDLFSWPGGLYSGIGSEPDWEDLKKRVLGFTQEGNPEYIDINPLNRFDELIQTGLPVLLIAGDSDRVVPFCENGELMQKAYQRAGREIRVIVKKGCDHHPHSLEDVTPITDFVTAYCK